METCSWAITYEQDCSENEEMLDILFKIQYLVDNEKWIEIDFKTETFPWKLSSIAKHRLIKDLTRSGIKNLGLPTSLYNYITEHWSKFRAQKKQVFARRYYFQLPEKTLVEMLWKRNGVVRDWIGFSLRTTRLRNYHPSQLSKHVRCICKKENVIADSGLDYFLFTET